MKRFDATRPKYNLLFKVVTILTNFVHRHRMDFHHDVVGELVDPIQGHGWDANYGVSIVNMGVTLGGFIVGVRTIFHACA